jgi:VWFA-related protein
VTWWRAVAVASSLGWGAAALAQPAATLRLLSPEPGTYVAGVTVLRAEVQPPSTEVRQVAFFVDGELVCAVQRPPYECRWDAGTALRRRQVRAVATLADGQRLAQSLHTRGESYVDAVVVDAVQVTAVVTDARGQFVKGLTAPRFVVREDGVRQNVSFFASEDAPLELVVAVDVSGSMADAIGGVKQSVKRFLAKVRAKDTVTVLGFNDNVFLVARRETNPEARLRAVDRLRSWGSTALYDATARALEMLARGTGRKAVVLFTDGEDRASIVSEADARRRVESSNAVVYAVAAGRAFASTQLRSSLGHFATASGGRAFFERDEAGLDRAFDEIFAELSNHYLLAYTSTNTARDDRWRRIQVEIPGADYRIRAREGYRLATPSAAPK